MMRENFIILRTLAATWKTWKHLVQSALVVLNLIFLQRIHRLF
jgi:hypothetical protein